MPTFGAPDGTQLAYRLDGAGAGDPVVCLPGGMQDSVYLGDLGGLSKHHRLAVLDLRGTGQSAVPDDESTYRCEHLVDDVEALREHLGLDRMDLLGHSAGANIAVMYAARHPQRVSKLALITPSTRAVGIEITGQMRRDAAQLRQGEPWFDGAYSALQATTAGTATDEDWEAIAPFLYGRWDEAAQRHHAAEDGQTNHEAAQIFASDSAFDPPATRAALAALDAPVLLVAGEVDLGFPARLAQDYAGLFARATVVVQRGAGHIPWLDDPRQLVAIAAAFLG
jgi:proline iminopeptidase